MLPNKSESHRRRKATKVEKEQRISQIVELLTEGVKPYHISKVIRDDYGWDLSDRQIRNYIKWAREYFINEARIDRDEQLGKALNRLNDLYFKAYGKKDYRTCLLIQRELNELAQLKVERFEGKQKVEVIIERVITSKKEDIEDD